MFNVIKFLILLLIILVVSMILIWVIPPENERLEQTSKVVEGFDKRKLDYR